MKPGQRKAGPKKKTLSSFLESHILGIIALFSDILDNAQSIHSLSERKRCLGAIKEMIILAKEHVGVALPQVSSHSSFHDPIV
jgi:serine/threonine-protein kinase ATR